MADSLCKIEKTIHCYLWVNIYIVKVKKETRKIHKSGASGERKEIRQGREFRGLSMNNDNNLEDADISN